MIVIEIFLLFQLTFLVKTCKFSLKNVSRPITLWQTSHCIIISKSEKSESVESAKTPCVSDPVTKMIQRGIWDISRRGPGMRN